MSSIGNGFHVASLRHSVLREDFLPTNLPPRRETALHSALNKRTGGRKRHPGAWMVKISIALPRSLLLDESHSWPMHPWKGFADFSNHGKKDRALNCMLGQNWGDVPQLIRLTSLEVCTSNLVHRVEMWRRFDRALKADRIEDDFISTPPIAASAIRIDS